MSEEKPRSKLRYANWLLVVLILAANIYVLASPLLPYWDLWRQKNETQAVSGLPYKTDIDTDKNGARQNRPEDNRVVIPKIALDEHIHQGNSAKVLNLGVWARPNTSTPPAGSNTVLTGHRFTYDGPATFYHLGKLAVGDKVVVYWHGKEYDYTVNSVKVVPPEAIEIEKPTTESQLTIYTCTPLWSAKDRLVVTAKLDEKRVP